MRLVSGSNSGPEWHSAVNRSPRFNPLRPRANGEKNGQVEALGLLVHSGKQDSTAGELVCRFILVVEVVIVMLVTICIILTLFSLFFFFFFFFFFWGSPNVQSK